MDNQSKIAVLLLGILTTMIFFTTASILPALAATTVHNQGASDFSPGHQAANFGNGHSAKEFAPGVIQGRLPGGGCDAPLNSPGHLFKQAPTTT